MVFAFAIFGIVSATAIGIYVITMLYMWIRDVWFKVENFQQYEFWRSYCDELKEKVRKLEAELEKTK